MKVLIAEDERISRHMLQEQLEKWGHQVTSAADGSEAWEKFQGDDFSIVVSDWMMPGLDGLELVRRVRRAADSSRYVYILLLTAKSWKKDIVAGMDAGADDFLSKPFDPDELRVRLRAGQRIIELERSLAERNRLLQHVNQTMKRDLEAAARVQRSLLPDEMPDVPGMRVAWGFRPCDELAGDFLNVFRLSPRHIGMYVADVSGHGVAASLLAAAISRVLTPHPSLTSRLVKPAGGDAGEQYPVISPLAVIADLNQRFPMEASDDRFFTILYAVLHVETRRLRYVSAGHPPIVLDSAGQAPRLLGGAGYAVGLFPDSEYEEHVVPLVPGDRLWIYSDGIPEAANPQGEVYGEERLTRAIAGSRTRPLRQSVSALLGEVESWCGEPGPRDDISILVVEIP